VLVRQQEEHYACNKSPAANPQNFSLRDPASLGLKLEI